MVAAPVSGCVLVSCEVPWGCYPSRSRPSLGSAEVAVPRAS